MNTVPVSGSLVGSTFWKSRLKLEEFYPGFPAFLAPRIQTSPSVLPLVTKGFFSFLSFFFFFPGNLCLDATTEPVGINFASSGFYRAEPELSRCTQAWRRQIENSGAAKGICDLKTLNSR